MVFVRYIIVSGLAGIVTLSLFFLMDSLIFLGMDDKIKKVPPNKMIDFIRAKREVEAHVEEEKLPEKIMPDEAPPPPELDMPSLSADPTAMALNIQAPDITDSKPDISMAGGPNLGSAPSDSDVIPMVRVQPMYPPSAAQRRIEGWVRMEFTISTTGSVIRAKVIKSQPPNIFDKAALRAIRKWKYKPKIVDGERVERRGVKVQLTFELDQM
ncbi:MAG: TonB family protein [Proteobacteria bacterium]|nr:TonB family protein [Pseudomonadota bacterium]